MKTKIDIVRPAASETASLFRTRARKLLKRMWEFKALYLMILPGVLYYIVYRYLPMYGTLIAFKDYSFTQGIISSPWANPWYKHFETFYDSPYFTQLLGNTFLISFYKLAFGIFPPIILALLLNECRVIWYKNLIQTLTYMPYFLSWVIIYGILIAFLSESSGIVNRIIVEAGGESTSFLTSTEWFRTILVGSDIWQQIGYGAIIYLAAMTAIDPTLYEAARVDGAGRLRMIWNVTLPGIRNVIILMLILRLGHFLDAGFEQIYIMYNVQVYPVADIVDTWVFRTGLQQLNFSLGAAVGLFKSIVGLILVLGANKLAKRWGGSIW